MRDAIIAALNAAGHTAEVVTAADEVLEAALAAAAAGPCDVLLVGGGDGTINAAARLLMDTTKPLGILPLGTMNMLARDLGLPLDPMAALDAMIHGAAEAIDVAEVNGLPFLCRSYIGLVPRLALLRERFRGKPWYRRLPGILWSFLTLVVGNRRFRLIIDAGKGPEILRTAAVVISNNAIEEGFGRLPARRSLTDGRLHLYILRYRSGLGVLWAGLLILLGAAGDAPGIEARTLTNLSVTSKKRHLVKVANDGEVHWLRAPLYYRIRPRSLWLLRPYASP